jgi:pimeloyl-ACP methyl ester carboxylesterase
MIAGDHLRIDAPGSRLVPQLFADYYRFKKPGDRAPDPPLICCWGGALYPKHYDALRRSHPERLMEEFEKIFDHERGPSFDVILLATPDTRPGSRNDLRTDLARTFADVLTKSPNPTPRSIGFLGYSAGACIATCLALDLPRARAVGTVGGIGMADVILETGRPRRDDLQFAAFINSDDPLADETIAFQDALATRGHPLVLHRGTGGHSLAAYLANGLLTRAGTWVRDALCPASEELRP